MSPKRIQRKRTKGWRMPKNTVCVGRPSRWGNPFRVREMYGIEKRKDGMAYLTVPSLKAAYLSYKDWLFKPQQKYLRRHIKMYLKGKNLACWCPLIDKNGNKVPCHADILLEIANQ